MSEIGSTIIQTEGFCVWFLFFSLVRREVWAKEACCITSFPTQSMLNFSPPTVVFLFKRKLYFSLQFFFPISIWSPLLMLFWSKCNKQGRKNKFNWKSLHLFRDLKYHYITAILCKTTLQKIFIIFLITFIIYTKIENKQTITT